jgi:predicted ester cyclase
MFRQVMESFRSATNKKVRWTGITVYKIVDRKVVQERGEEDFLGFLRQIGAAPRSRTNT